MVTREFLFAAPLEAWVLWGLAAFLAAIFALAAIPSTRKFIPYTMGPLVLRALAAALLVMVLCYPIVREKRDEGTFYALADISESFAPQLRARTLERLGTTVPESVRLVGRSFGKGVSPSADISGARGALALGRGSEDPGATDIAGAIAAAERDGAHTILLASDGFETAGDVFSLLDRLGESAPEIYPIIPEDARDPAEPELDISELYAPLLAPAKGSIPLRASIRNGTSAPKPVIVDFYQGTKLLESKRVELAPESEAVTLVDSKEPETDGLQEFRVSVREDGDSVPAVTRRAWVTVRPRPKVLLASGSADDAKLLQTALTDQAYRVESKIGSLGDVKLADYSTVILNNIGNAQIGRARNSELAQSVGAGTALIMVGGEKSFGLGGYIDTPLASVLPVELVPPHTEKKRLNVAVQLVLDKSNSMNTSSRLEFTKEAAREVIRNLKDEDYVGVIGFDTTPFIVVKIGNVGEIRSSALERIGRLIPAGQTNLAPALDEARRGLQRVNAGRKHIIALTDGQLPDAGPFYVEMIKQMRLNGITVSTVLIGEDDGLLRRMAGAGGGAYYQTNDPRTLPRILTTDVKVSTGEKTLVEESSFPVREGPDGIRSTKVRGFPALLGYVQTKPRSGAALELVVERQDRAEPLLARWNRPGGEVIAFTSDANGRWSAPWARGDRYREFWHDLVRSLQEQGATPGSDMQFDLKHRVTRGELELELHVFSPVKGEDLALMVKLPDGTAHRAPLRLVSSGRFRAIVEKPAAGVYQVTPMLGEVQLPTVAFELTQDNFGEQKGHGFNRPFLEELAARSGGRVNPTLEALGRRAPPKAVLTDLRPWFLGAALAFLLLELFVRTLARRRRVKFSGSARQIPPSHATIFPPPAQKVA